MEKQKSEEIEKPTVKFVHFKLATEISERKVEDLHEFLKTNWNIDKCLGLDINSKVEFYDDMVQVSFSICGQKYIMVMWLKNDS